MLPETGNKMAAKFNSKLTEAKNNKKDEFYPQLSDISNELKHYKHHL
jgi:recombinational DNA repair protein RecR